MNCTNAGCEFVATRIVAWAILQGRSMFVAPYCDEHADEIEREQGGVPAAGPALSDEAAKIEGV